MIEIPKHQPWMLRLSKQNCSKVKENLKNINQILPTKMQCCQIKNFKKDQTFSLNDQICDRIPNIAEKCHKQPKLGPNASTFNSSNSTDKDYFHSAAVKTRNYKLW